MVNGEDIMYNMTLEEMMLCAKVFAYAMGDRSINLHQVDRDSVVCMLKRMADQRWDWSENQKEQFKTFIEICKQQN